MGSPWSWQEVTPGECRNPPQKQKSSNVSAKGNHKFLENKSPDVLQFTLTVKHPVWPQSEELNMRALSWGKPHTTHFRDLGGQESQGGVQGLEVTPDPSCSSFSPFPSTATSAATHTIQVLLFYTVCHSEHSFYPYHTPPSLIPLAFPASHPILACLEWL